MKRSIIVVGCLALSACSAYAPKFRTLDAVIIDAATRAKATNASEVSVEMSVTSAYKTAAGVPISVVNISGEKSVSAATKVTVKIGQLDNWTPPPEQMLADGRKPSGTYKLDQRTNTLVEVP